jgi:hypothetical protein
MTKKLVSCLGLFALAGCVDGEAREGTANRIAVAEPNSLGVVALEIERSGAGVDREVELRALTVEQQTVADVRVRSGLIPGLSDDLPGRDDLGSEIVFIADGNELRFVTRERNRFVVPPPEDRVLAEVISLEIARTTLAREANVIIDDPFAAADDSNDRAYYTQACSASQLLVSPLAKQCCYGPDTGSPMTALIRPDNKVGYRFHRGQANGGPLVCRMSDGSSCSGSNCYYGPLGFTAPSLASGTGYPRVETAIAAPTPGGTLYRCSHTFYASPQPPQFGDVAGVNGRACGCACDGSARRCLDTGSVAYSQGGTCAQANGLTCASTSCPLGGGGGADNYNY